MSARDELYAYAGTPSVLPEHMLDAALDTYRAENLTEAKVETVGWLVKKSREYRTAGGEHNALTADAIQALASKVDRGAVRAFLGTAHYRDVIDEQRAAERRAILGDDLNPSALVLDAQAYRRLADDVTATMPDPDRWDGDEDEGTVLARYVRHIAAQLVLATEFRVPLPYGLDWLLVQREAADSDRWAVTSSTRMRAWVDRDGWKYITEIGRAAAFAYGLDEALNVAEHVVQVEQERFDGRIRARREGGAE
ncbi:hypothetical protein [Streptomyces sp. A13(2022)]|uniref:hypothetical protein n=1 Tax=Streptomyces sp. A13(2022) TaxID=2964768 RepID=UPI0021DA3DFA|nr:hypothetical protein [Streptomyces sp. A13(2022)]MCU8589354.1 hypothetical protein [Streptomyces sp. A13(2022)]